MEDLVEGRVISEVIEILEDLTEDIMVVVSIKAIGGKLLVLRLWL